MKAELPNDINMHFADVTAEPFYAVATLVDLCYRGKLFSPVEQVTVTHWLTKQADLVPLQSPSPSADESSTAAAFTITDHSAAERP